MKRLLLSVLTLSLVAGCHHREKITFDETSLATKGLYETVWVNPTVVYSDSLSTLIGSERLDSVFVRNTERRVGEKMPSIEFATTEAVCPVTLALTERSGLLVYRLYRGMLPRANYKLTIDPTYMRAFSHSGENGLEVRVTVCEVTTRYPLDLTGQ